MSKFDDFIEKYPCRSFNHVNMEEAFKAGMAVELDTAESAALDQSEYWTEQAEAMLLAIRKAMD